MNLLTQYLLARFLGADEGRRVYPILVSGLRHKTSETNESIGELAATIRASPNLQKINPRRAFTRTLRTSSHPQASVRHPNSEAELDAFLAEYGVRGFTREVYYPRWGDEPAYIFDILKSLASGEAVDTAAAEERSDRLRGDTEKTGEGDHKGAIPRVCQVGATLGYTR